ncbi:hypothetical protein HGO40_22910 [Pseudomonas sp. CG7]|uniref:hypothetical protein n=1 Tax=Pseudomonas sp. CG7 TaxID=191007 RepID=UPI0020334570|nr:hypothetical protein [Pseudomonas sp. CG7]MCM2463283.1 hypothetical protein [Pseudomonas sp. CG7]
MPREKDTRRVSKCRKWIWLENQMDHCDLTAEWLYLEFSYEYALQTFASWQQEFAEGQRDGRWKCLIATEHGQLPGDASLASNDLSELGA